MPPAAKSLVIQLVALAAACGVAALITMEHALPWLAFAGIQGASAAVLSMLAKQPRWWWGLHLIFMPALVLARGVNVDAAWFLVAFVVLALLYWNSARGQVPLYLSNAMTARAVLALLPQNRPATLIDAGCGTGSLLARVARARPDCRVIGLENAPLPWLVAWVRTGRLRNCHVRFGNLWASSFAEADVVYAFLSPVPMPRLWEKLCAQMKPGTMLVSNSFDVPGVVPEQVVEVADRRGTRLFCYRIHGSERAFAQAD